MTHEGSTVFLVDDDSDIRSSLTRALSKRGFSVEAFASADAFLAQYDPSRAGCLVLDYGMPKINGLELQQMLIERGAMIRSFSSPAMGGCRNLCRRSGPVRLIFWKSRFVRRHLLSVSERPLMLMCSNARKGWL